MNVSERVSEMNENIEKTEQNQASREEQTQKKEEKDKKKESKNQEKNRTNFFLFSLNTGFFAGLIWGAVKGFFYYMSFTTIVPGYLVEPFFKHSFLQSTPGHYTGWGFFTLFSIIATMLYVFLLRKLKGPLPGMLYGVVWWCIIFLLAGPMTGMTPPFRQLSMNTLVVEFCLYLLWGLFIGYTAAAEFTDERKREPNKTSMQ